MGTFVDNSLIRGESVQSNATISWLSQFGKLAFGTFLILWGCLSLTLADNIDAAILVLITLVGGGALFLAFALINVVTTELAITNKKLIGKVGFIRRFSIDIPHHQIESLNVTQGIIGRILRYGKITVRGAGGNKVSIPYIKEPLQFRKVVMGVIDKSEKSI